MHILDGTGAGQYRRLTAFSGAAITVDRPWDLAPDTSSVLSVVNFFGRALLIDNVFDDQAEFINAYYSSADVIFSGNRVTYPTPVRGTFSSSGGGIKTGVSPNWHFQCLRNEIVRGAVSMDSKGNPAQYRDTGYTRPLGLDYTWFKGPTSRATIFRGNVVGHPPIGLQRAPGSTLPSAKRIVRLGNRLLFPVSGAMATFLLPSGREAWRTRVGESRILDLSHLPAGLYLVKSPQGDFKVIR